MATTAPDPEDERRARVRREEVVAGPGLRALEGDDPDELLRDATGAVAETLAVGTRGAFEGCSSGTAIRLRAGVGWCEGSVGRATAPVDPGSPVGRALESAKPVALEGRVDCGDLLEEAMADLEVKIAEHDAEIDADPLPRVYGDPSRVRRMFQNLLCNAISYAGDDPPRISVSAANDGQTCTISVQDNGIGIDPADADATFEVFNRLHAAEEYAGTAIGLALCRRVVERHDGRIWVESTPGEGSTFSFTLQAAPETNE